MLILLVCIYMYVWIICLFDICLFRRVWTKDSSSPNCRPFMNTALLILLTDKVCKYNFLTVLVKYYVVEVTSLFFLPPVCHKITSSNTKTATTYYLNHDKHLSFDIILTTWRWTSVKRLTRTEVKAKTLPAEFSLVHSTVFWCDL